MLLTNSAITTLMEATFNYYLGYFSSLPIWLDASIFAFLICPLINPF